MLTEAIVVLRFSYDLQHVLLTGDYSGAGDNRADWKYGLDMVSVPCNASLGLLLHLSLPLGVCCIFFGFICLGFLNQQMDDGANRLANVAVRIQDAPLFIR
ncbi:hypothetical protein Nepgr_015778 [Nepenthes gracilis]|uniref:Uncharacterized protein n=1 Tax=Nepenthes gracilis TaxID=150966 RepID=A0AAD3SNV2_NEPGR|nr:hypothetical protein Nepgr_015778 [Nepenthes gracilis]